MKVFISWSGERSQAVAEALYEWLPSVIQAVQPWMSANDIDKGTRWRSGLANELEQVSVSITCLTPENLESPWIHFEAGALSKQQQNTYVCTFLFGLKPIDLREPLAQFQATKAEKEDTRKLIHTINRVLGNDALPETKVNEAFDVWWPKFEHQLSTIEKNHPKLERQISNHVSKEGLEPQRDIREVLGEILELVRAQSREIRQHVNQPVQQESQFIKGSELSLQEAQALSSILGEPLYRIKKANFSRDAYMSLQKEVRELGEIPTKDKEQTDEEADS